MGDRLAVVRHHADCWLKPQNIGLFLRVWITSNVPLMAHLCLFDTPLGACGIAWRGDTVIATRLPDKTPEYTAHRLAARAGATIGEPPDAVRHAIHLMITLLEGERADLSAIVCDFGDTDPFAAKVYTVARAVPAGETSTYGAVAFELGDGSLARRVGQALGRNPVPIIVPCHRIIGTNGKLVGFSADGGVEMKLRMLEIEGAQIGSAPGLFGDLPLATKPRR